MKFSFKELISQLSRVLQKLSRTQQITLALVIGASVITIITLIIWAVVASRPGNQVLFSNLAMEDAGEVAAKLAELRVPYEIHNDGRTILVPGNVVHETRLNLAQQGLPRGSGVGFEIFDSAGIGMTEFIQKVNFRRALQGELGRTISAIDGIESARVHIALPERSLFISQDRGAEASVALRLSPHTRLSGDQVKGIIHLVSSSVEGLTPEGVTVVDEQGRILNDLIQERSEESTLSVTQLMYQRNMERNLQIALDNLLVSVLGQGNSYSNVSLELDFDKVEQQIEAYDPANVPRSEQRIEEREQGREAQGGIPGVRANIADQDDPEAGLMTTRSREVETTNYEVGRTLTQITRSRGQIKRLTVAVAVNGNYVQQQADGVSQVVYQPRSSEELDKITALVQSAIGYNEGRGDRVVVTNLQFGEPPKSRWQELMEMQDLWKEMLKYLGIALFFLFAFIFIIRPIVKWVTDMTRDEDELKKTFGTGQKKPKQLVPTQLPKTLAELEAEMESQIDSESSVSASAVRGKVIRKKLSDIVQENPAGAAQLIRIWINDDKTKGEP
ncbi:flagellar M-ring protein FliF [Desulfurispirillum indicum S5]|uniref:Flagellar M-ring protein n=1 Tax=Desulfurispirillum indicum (strain ATCC BAA-1389 / DSM 22839 / S5) TaxID=653733 RepID=E6W3P6_DESIS|nr:flagellar basal-body MS-ring/collar protein FliF [Desulfurispirillum indicum]ADU66927.1 flagellar M-ring protein FliF [Desulfurispirillum indicum S5]